MPNFFIEHPKFAWVIAIFIIVASSLSLSQLPISSYPNIAPPTITINATYPGASATTIENTVTKVIENNMSGIQGLDYIASESSRTGTATITLTFKLGTDVDNAGVSVQNRLKRVESSLPESVTQQGLIVDKSSPNYLMILALYSPNNTFNSTDLGNYISENIISDIRRIDGIGSAEPFGSEYAMRVWLDSKKMAFYGVTPEEVVSALRTQNAQLATGELGALPSPAGQQLNATVIVPSRLSTVDEFGSVILRSSSQGSVLSLRDIARIELGAQNYNMQVILNGENAAAFSTKLSNTGNTLLAAKAVKAKMEELQQHFPEDMEWISPYDTSLFVEISIKEVIMTLIIAVVLVTAVMFAFLQNWRTTIIPLIVVPISLIGSTIGLYFFGFSINILTLFGMILAIGIVVDDAILVVENIVRLMNEENLEPYEATKKSMRQITSVIIGTTLVLIAVYIPMAFISGSAGEIYKQFSMSIVVSVVISSFLALSLTPAIAQSLLKSGPPKPSALVHALSAPGRLFNYLFAELTQGYIWLVKKMLTTVGLVISLLIFVSIIFYDYQQYNNLPKSFIPSEDQGFILTGALLPSGATQERTHELAEKTNAWLKKQPEVKDILTVLGYGPLGTGQNTSITFVNLHNWTNRIAKNQRDAETLIADTNEAFQMFVGTGLAFAFNMPPIPGLGNSNGFDFKLQDRSGSNNLTQLKQATTQMMELAAKAQNKKVVGLRSNTLPPAPQLKIDIDRVKARSLDVNLNSLNSTLEIALGSAYVNDYIYDGKVHQVWVQANKETRSSVAGIMGLQITNTQGGLVDLAEIASAQWIQGPTSLTRYNGFPSIPLTGTPAPGVSSGDAIAAMETYAAQLPKTISYQWSGKSLQEKISSGQTILVFLLSIFIIFLVLVALYESWTVPISVMLVVPLGILGCVMAVAARNLTNDVYFTVGMITIIGLSTKNSIVIVQFARDLQHQGMNAYDAVITACKLRFRPILMTSFAFALGVMPLVLATGAGSASRRDIGTAVIGGVLSATALAVIFVPVFYLIIIRMFPQAPLRIKPEYTSDVNTPEIK